MAVKNKFPVLIKTIEDIQSGKTGLKIFREELNIPAQSFNKHIVDWLKNKKYPLRKGLLTNQTDVRIDELYGQTPTKRLHPGSLPLWQAQRYRIRKVRNQWSLNIIFENLAEHAPLFFDEVKPHGPIVNNDPTKRLKFWSGTPLPWMPANVRGWSKTSGAFFPWRVDHPGHESYANLVIQLFSNYKHLFTKSINKAGKRIGGEIRKSLG